MCRTKQCKPVRQNPPKSRGNTAFMYSTSTHKNTHQNIPTKTSTYSSPRYLWPKKSILHWTKILRSPFSVDLAANPGGNPDTHSINGRSPGSNWWRYVNVPYVWPYFLGIFPYIGLKHRPRVYGRYLKFRFLKWPLIYRKAMVFWYSVCWVYGILIYFDPY